MNKTKCYFLLIITIISLSILISIYYNAGQHSLKTSLLLFLIISILWIIIYFVLIKKKIINITQNKKNNDIKNYNNLSVIDLDYIIKLAKENNNELLLRFHEFNPEFAPNLYNINPLLSNSDMILCIMIWLGFSSKEISQYTFIEHRSVQTKKNRLRKKLNIDSHIDIYMFLQQIDHKYFTARL